MVAFPTGGVAADLGSDPDLAAEVRDWLGVGDGSPSAADVVAGVAVGVAVDDDPGAVGVRDGAADALVGLVARPSLLVGERQLATPIAHAWQARLLPYGPRLVASARAVGRVEVASDPVPGRLLGTAVLVAPDVAVTSPSVAAAVVAAQAAGAAVRVSFGETRLQDWPRAAVAGVGPVGDRSGSGSEAVGILVLRQDAATGALPAPLALLNEDPRPDRWVAVVGCPPEADAVDPTRPVSAPKRLAPGARLPGGGHDAAVLPGSDGSAVLDVETGALVAVQLSPPPIPPRTAPAGDAADPVPGPTADAGAVLRAVRAVRPDAAVTLQLPRSDPADTSAPAAAAERDAAPVEVDPAAHTDDRPSAATSAQRPGYDAAFLGADDRLVPLPGIPDALAAQLVAVDVTAAGSQRYALPYEHFSVVQHGGRRMALFVAGNIDGAAAQAIKRGSDPWARDPRIAPDSQWGDELYHNNDLDKGHLVRRLDPAWGPTATVGEADTFFYTNSCPQFHRFNDGVWGDLEDYLLHNASTLGFRATVFTGPVFDDADPTYRDARIPLRFWKVAVMVDSARQRLSATGYLLDQTGMGASFDFVFGAFGTSQVPLSRLEALTGLDWGALRPFDPLDAAGVATPLADVTAIRL